jgi:type VI secretion system protein ImpJ
VDVAEVSDENAGGPRQEIEIRKLRGRFFFGDESREGYECLPVALIRRAGHGSNAPVVADEVFPPLLRISAWPGMIKLCESIVHRVEAKHRFLRAEVDEGRIDLDVSGAAGWQPILKLQIVGGFVFMLRQLASAGSLHPFIFYLEMSRLAGELSIFEDEGLEGIEVPVYEHEKLGECFHAAAYSVERLLEKILSGRFIRVPFELEGDTLVARLREEWLGPGSKTYLCIDSDLSDRALLGKIETAKIGAPPDLAQLKQRRLFGLDIQLLSRAPGGLPARPSFHYFSVAAEGTYWDGVVRHREMAISGAVDPKMRFGLYIVLRPESGMPVGSR